VPLEARNVVRVAAGRLHTLALRADGTLVGWGAGTTNAHAFPDFGQTIIPARATNVVAISCGTFHSVALKADGTVIAWGDNSARQAAVPAGTSNVVMVSAGGSHSLLLKADGSIIGLGNNENGELSVPTNLLFTSDLPVAVSGSVDANVPGVYLLTYTVTNIMGEIGTATRTVVVTDSIAPTIVCPANRTATAGAHVFFTVEAHDLCAGSVPVNCNPLSGTVFPVGTNSVVCSATDPSGNRSQCSFTITVLGPLSSKAAVLNEIESQSGTNREPDFVTAIKRLNRSVSPGHWLDEIHLQDGSAGAVFWNEALVARTISRLLRRRVEGISDALLQDWLDRLVEIDRAIAASKIDEAVQAGASATKLAAASRSLNRGDRARDEQRPATAILFYLQAWRAAARAELLSKTPVP
jgi:hypothetical protein